MDQSFQMLSTDPPFSDEDLELIELTEADIVEEGDPDRLVERVKPVYQVADENPWDLITEPETLSGYSAEPVPQVFSEPEPFEDVIPPKDPLMTSTLAELYVSQGFTDKALEIYRGLLEANPESETVALRLAELEKQQQKASLDESVSFSEEATLSPESAAVVTKLEGWLENIRRLRECR